MFGSKKSKNILKFVCPAKSWEDGLVCGNGEVGLNVFGGASREVVVVNHANLVWGGKTGVLPDVSDKTKFISRNLNELNYREANQVLSDALVAKNYKPELSYPLPMCDFVLEEFFDDNVVDYSRQLNMDNGEISSEFKVKNVKFERNIFVSKLNDTIYYNISSNVGKKINCFFSIVQHDKRYNRTENFENFNVNFMCESKADKEFEIFSCRNTDGTDFGCVAKVVCLGGSVSKTADKFVIKNADNVLIVAKTFINARAQDKISEIKESMALMKVSYEKVLKEHTAVFSKLINNTNFDLFSNDCDNLDEGFLSLKTKQFVPSFYLEKLYSYGKYLFACSSKYKILPCGLFGGHYRLDQSTTNNYLQLQRLYNFGFKCGLFKDLKPVFETFYDNLDDYKKNSTRLFGCKGIYIPSLESPESGLVGSTTPDVVMNYNVASYVSCMIYQYFVNSNDVDFMNKMGFELVEETGMFYEDFFRENKTTKVFESAIGYSPFNTATNIGVADNCSIASNCVCDFVCARQVFYILNQLCILLDKPEKDIDKWAKLLEKIPDVEVDNNGYIKEYIGNAFATNNASPHIPHLFPYNIGFRPFEVKNDFDDLVANTAKFRYANCFGKFDSAVLGDLALTLATCGDARGSFEVLNTLIKNFAKSNLIIDMFDGVGMGVGKFRESNVFNIDKNLEICAIIQNMFINSSRNNLFLFKNLPQVFNKGSISNLILDNQIKADLEFNLKRGIAKLKLKSPSNISVNLYLPSGLKKLKGIDEKMFEQEHNVIKGVSLQANKVLALKLYLGR